MNHIYIAICDDEAAVLDVVSGAIVSTFKKYNLQAEVEIFHRARDLEKRMKERSFDLLFLDIEMPVMDGITFAKRLRAANSRIDIIFISSREDKVFDALRTNPGGFIRKKRFLEDVSSVIAQWMENRPARKKMAMVIEGREGTATVELDDILYIEGNDKVQQIHLSDRKQPMDIRKTMAELENALSDKGFLRVHKGFLVNYKFIRRLENTEAVLTNGERIPLSRRRVQEIRTRYMELMQDGRTLIL